MMTKIYDLAYEVDEDGSVNVEQDAGFGEVSRITLHPIHVRLLAEQVGLLAPSSNIEADRTIARLTRQMRILFDRIDRLDDWLNAAAQRGHEDLEMETTYSFATWELANEFCADLPLTASQEGKRAAAPGPAALSPVTANTKVPPAASENNQTKSNGRGGARPGAGRKPGSKQIASGLAATGSGDEASQLFQVDGLARQAQEGATP